MTSTTDPRVLAVTVNYRTQTLCERALASLAVERERLPGLGTVVVDNASGDGSAEALGSALVREGWEAWARVVASPRNGGFAAGNNLAIAPALAADPPDYFLLLNPDAEVRPGAVKTLVDFLAAHPRAGFAGPRTEIGPGNVRGTAFRFPGVLNSFDEGLHLGLASRLLARWRLQPEPRDEAHRTDWLSGGCVLIRREVFERAGLFDEGYFLYYEEVDLMRRARGLGFEAWFVPESHVVHHAGAATGLTGGRELERRVPSYWFESRRRYFLRHRGRGVLLLADLAWLLGNGLWNVRRGLTRAPRKEPPGFYGDFLRFFLLGSRGLPGASR